MSRIESYSSLSTLLSCAEKYRLSRIERLEPPGLNLPQHMGKAFHAALGVLYSQNWDPGLLEEAESALRREWGDIAPPLGARHAHLTLDFALRRLALYVENRERSPTKLETSEIVTPFVEELHEFEWFNEEGEGVKIRGIPDFAIREPRGLRVVDSKTTSSWVNESYALRFRIGMQLRVYAAMIQNLTGEIVRGGIVNVIYVGDKALDEPDKWKRRKSSPSMLIPVDFTQGQIDEAWEWVRGGLMVRDACAEAGLWPKNELACGDYGGCEFLPLCTAPSEASRRARMMTQFRRKETR